MGPEGGGRVFPWNFVRLCSRLFFWDTSKFFNNWSLIFSEVLWGGQINCKIVLDILEKLAGFHTTAREPRRAHLRVPAFNHTTKIQRNDPQERKKE